VKESIRAYTFEKLDSCRVNVKKNCYDLTDADVEEFCRVKIDSGGC
jgi:hypothetical protein